MYMETQCLHNGRLRIVVPFCSDTFLTPSFGYKEEVASKRWVIEGSSHRLIFLRCLRIGPSFEDESMSAFPATKRQKESGSVSPYIVTDMVHGCTM